MHSHENELFQDVPGVKKPRLKYVMGDDGYYKLNDYGFQLHRIDFLNLRLPVKFVPHAKSLS